MENDKIIIGYCYYCKNPIYSGEAFVVSENNTYHATENEEHDNCYFLLIDKEEE